MYWGPIAVTVLSMALAVLYPQRGRLMLKLRSSGKHRGPRKRATGSHSQGRRDGF